ncbi:hypothetical protein MBLNU230_g4949t1 [Neophaeotheca triangularis]
MSAANGYALGFDANGADPSPQPTRSESDLSDVNDISTTLPTESRQDENAASEDDAMHDMATSDEGDSADAAGEEDADFDEEAPSPEPASGMRHDRSGSDDSQRSSKRKAGEVDDDEYMKQNPELYGLRRSVPSSDDEDEGEDAVNTGNRRKRQKTASNRPAAMRNANQTSARASSADSDEDEDDVYGGARGRTFAKKHRRLQAVQSSKGTPSTSEVRFSTRRAAKVTNYNEEEDYGLSEEDEDDTVPYQYVEEDTSAGIDQVLNHRLRDGVADPAEATKHDYEFYIKWQGQAHYHSTWEQWANLSSLRGFRRLENYFRKKVKVEQALAHEDDVAPEEREKWNLDRETELDTLNEHMKVERVIGAREGDEEMEYYVKWKGLMYDSCTWEPASLVSELAQTEVDRYLDRSSKLPTSRKSEANPATRTEYKAFHTQPDYIQGGQLREFQIHGLNFLSHHWCKGNNVILADEMGLGKTVQTVSFMSWLKHERGQQGPFIVVVPLSTMPAWADTFDVWTPDLNYIVYNGSESARKIIKEHELLIDGNPNKIKFNVLLTTYEYILADSDFLSKLKWQFMAVDEAHRLKNRDSQLYAKLMGFGAPSRLLITGTPMQNNISELSALMDFLMPGKIVVDEDLDLASEGASEKLAELTDAIQPYMIRRTKQKVENDLPPKTEKIIRVELSDVQLEYYKNILTRNYTALNAGAKGQKQSLLNIMMELKKASNHPFMFPNAEERILAGNDSREEMLKALITSSGKMMLLDRLLTKLKKDGHRVLIFSQMVKMLDLLSDYLHVRGHQHQRLDGTIASGPRRMAIDHFNAADSLDFCFLLSTRAGGLGINLMTADTVILFDSDWNPQADLQAMARAHRIGQKNPVTIYRLVSKDTVEEEILERARNKLMLEYITIQRGVTDREAKDLGDRMARAGANVTEPTSSDDISRILKKRGQKMFEQSNNQKKLEELDIDAVLENAEEHRTEQPEGITTDGGEEFLKSFEYTDVKLDPDLEWDQIIPKEHLEKIREEERKKDEEKYLESVIEENQPRKRGRAPDDAEEARAQRAAKKRARDLAAEAAAGGESSSDSEAGPSNQRAEKNRDPKRPLNEKECRNLIRAHERYGNIEERQDDVIREARLIGRDVDVIKSTLQEVIDTSLRLLKEEDDRVAEIERTTQKSVTKKDRKAVLFDFRGVKRLNAETIRERPIELRMVRDVVEQVSDWRNFRVPEASKPATYTCPWGAREDGMLCVGIARHGYGAWVAIRDDEELGLSDKFFLEEHRVDKKEERTKAEDKTAKSPGAVHLVRRANYLLSVLKDKTSNGTNIAAKRALENHHRNNRKHMGQFHGRGFNTPTNSASPAPGAMKGRNFHQSDIRGSISRDGRPGHGSPNGYRKPASPHGTNGDVKLTDDERRVKRVLDPVGHLLLKVQKATKKHMQDDDARLKTIKTCLIGIGNRIVGAVREHRYSSPLEDKIWDEIAHSYWPGSKKVEQQVTGTKLKAMYAKLSGKDPKAAVAAPPPSKDKPSAGAASPGAQLPRPGSETQRPGSGTPNGSSTHVRSTPLFESRKLPDFKRDPLAPDLKRESSELKREGSKQSPEVKAEK